MIPAMPPALDFSITGVDYTTLPEALLVIAKQHMRVDFPDDDEIIKRYLASAIAHVELVSGWRIFGTNVSWFPALSGAYSYQTPVRPCTGFSVVLTDPPPDADISADFALVADTPILPTWLMHKDRTPFPTPITMTLAAGYADIDTLPPNVSDVILRIAGTLYQNRESVTQPSFDQIPFWMNDLIVGMWIPRA